MFDPSITTGWMPLDPPRTAEQQVRDWLCSQVGIAADAIPLIRDARGRPRLQGALVGHDISWSHSGGRLLVAFASGVDLGVDVEHMGRQRDVSGIAERFFTPNEQEWLASFNGDAASTAFHRLWCAKEAVLKAHGQGISFGLDRLEFACVDGALQLAICDPALGEPASWKLREWSPAPGYLAALAWRPR